MARLASRRNRRAPSIQSNPIPGEVWLTTFSTDGANYIEFQLSSASNVQDTTDAALLSGWVWNYWSTGTGAMASEALTRLEAIPGGLRVYVPNIPAWNPLQPFALMWPHTQQLVRGILGEVLTSTAISDAVGTKDNAGLFAAIRSSGGSAPTDWTAQAWVTSATIAGAGQILLTFSTNVDGADTASGISVNNNGPVISTQQGAFNNQVLVNINSGPNNGDEITVSPVSGLTTQGNGYPVAPGTFRL